MPCSGSSLDGRVENVKTRFQFTLVRLHVAVVLTCVLAAAVHYVGVWWVILAAAWLAAFGVLVVSWGIIYVAAPQATKYGAVCGLMGALLLSLLSLAVLNSREEARRNLSIRRLRTLGDENAVLRDLRGTEPNLPPGSIAKSLIFNVIPTSPLVAQSAETDQR